MMPSRNRNSSCRLLASVLFATALATSGFQSTVPLPLQHVQNDCVCPVRQYQIKPSTTLGGQARNYRFKEPFNSRNLPSLARLEMALVPLTVDELERLISSSGKPTGAQYATYWGRTKKERYGRFIESATVGFLGVFFSYFLSFVLGGFVATILGSMFFFWGVLSPEFKAYQRNWEFLGGRQLVDIDLVAEKMIDPDHAGLYGGLFLAHIADVCVVEDANDTVDFEYDLSEFSDYTMETDELDRYTGQPYLLRVQCTDKQGRTLQIHTRLTEDYLHLLPGMPAATLFLSTSPKFTKLAALTDVFVLATQHDVGVAGLGTTLYLDRPELEAVLAEDDNLWTILQDEADNSYSSNFENRGWANASDRNGDAYDIYGDCSSNEKSGRPKVLIATRRSGRK